MNGRGRLHTAATVLLVALLLIAGAFPAAAAGALTSVSAELSTTYAGATGVTMTVKFTARAAVNGVGERFTVDLSSGPFTGAVCGNITVSPSPGTPTCSIASNVITWAFNGSITAGTAYTVTITSLANPSPVATSYYPVVVQTRTNAAVVDDGFAYAVVFPSATATQVTSQSTLSMTLTHSPGPGVTFDLAPSGPTSDTGKSTAVVVTTNGNNGFAVTLHGNRSTLEHTAYPGAIIANTWPGASTMVASAWPSGTGFGYSLDGGSTYLVVDTVPRTVHSGAGPTAVTGSSKTINYKAAIGYDTAGTYVLTLTFIVTPSY